LKERKRGKCYYNKENRRKNIIKFEENKDKIVKKEIREDRKRKYPNK
jgi:hypothetical protein